MFDIGKMQQLRKVAKNPSESEYVQALVTILVELEHRQLERVEALHDALGIDGIQVNSTREQRKEQLHDLAEHVAQGEFTSWWFSSEGPVGQNIENPDDAMPYAGLSEEEWQQQIDQWAANYRSKTDEFANDGNREIARQHVQRQFGVSLGEFEREVVNYSRKDALRNILAGNFEAVISGIEAATASVEASNGGEDDE